MKLNHFVVYFKLTQHSKLTMLQKKKQNTKLSIYNDHNFVKYTLGKYTKILTIFLDWVPINRLFLYKVHWEELSDIPIWKWGRLDGIEGHADLQCGGSGCFQQLHRIFGNRKSPLKVIPNLDSGARTVDNYINQPLDRPAPWRRCNLGKAIPLCGMQFPVRWKTLNCQLPHSQ